MTQALSRRHTRPQILPPHINPWALLLQAVTSPSRPEPPQFMTLDQASDYIGLSVPFLRRAIRTGKLASVRDGRTPKVHRANLDTLKDLAQLTRTAANELREALAERKTAQ